MKKNSILYGLIKPDKNLQKLLLKMKITVLFMAFSVLNSLAVSIYSQATKISLNERGSSIEAVLDKIEQESEFYFLL